VIQRSESLIKADGGNDDQWQQFWWIGDIDSPFAIKFPLYTNGDNGDPLVICTIVAIGTMIANGTDWDNGTDGAIGGNGDNCDPLFTMVFFGDPIEYPMMTIATIEAWKPLVLK
jgi:hypothetical protein